MRLHQIIEARRGESSKRVIKPVPDTLYHGTSLSNYHTMRKSNVFWQDSEAKGNYGFSTTEDLNVAIRFARWKSGDQRWGVILSLDGTALARRHRVVPHRDGDTIDSEYEWVVTQRGGKPIPNANSYITEVGFIDLKGDPNWVQSRDDAAVRGMLGEAAENVRFVFDYDEDSGQFEPQ